eukprot:CAMPEP_0174982044 /NCGR_PEP_ID=MMETSP0004_2-20121128/16247_1 /TAXON_ID=420556 /ORGANISM="Ochromonas sp., Strain CCMP1393" /LENGTH=162 /DNA_ID=CAMNT_0016233897 /DNA_START=69 /DNA_END=557 /DNA_ORIENTATION=+
MSQLNYKKFEEFDFGLNPRLNNKSLTQNRCHQYVPYADVSAQELPKVLDITNQERRVYLMPQQKRKGFSLGSKGLWDDDESTAGQAFDPRRVLDLGVAPLQRIINEMRSVTSGNNDEGSDHKIVARASGLVKYCDYLKGEETREFTTHPLRNKPRGYARTTF